MSHVKCQNIKYDTHLTGADGALTIKPQNDVITNEHRMKLNCTTDDQHAPVQWKYAAPGFSLFTAIYNSGKLVHNYSLLYRIDDSRKGQFILLAASGNSSMHAGMYRCVDNNGQSTEQIGVYDVTWIGKCFKHLQ